MALTPEQITAQNFKDFYMQILPYLGKGGGGGSMNYSTDEQVVGTWIDGKPIYQKTYTGLNVDMDYNQWTSIVAAPEGANLIIKNTLLGKASSNDPIDISGSGYELFIEDGYIKGEWNQNVNRRNIIAITLQYTKTTD